MGNNLLIESRDPFEFQDVQQFYDLAHQLSQSGHQVTMYLVQDGVFAARSGAKTGKFGDLAKAGKIKILADDFSLEERGILQDSMASGIQPSNIDHLVDLMLDGSPKTIWH